MQVVGVDVWSKAWVAVAVDSETGVQDVRTSNSLEDLVSEFSAASTVAVDIPIGLPVGEPRRADIEARSFVRPRASSVFTTPHRDVLKADSYQQALALSRKRYGRGLSAQSYALGAKILEAEKVASVDSRVIEVHPEVSFRALSGEPLVFAKKTWNGQMERRRLLAGAGLMLPDELAGAGRVPPDDVLDACVAAWSGLRIAAGQAGSLPDPPEVVSGRPVAIWY